MTALQIIGLLAFIIAIAGVLGYLFQSGEDKEEEFTFTTPEYTKEELENIKLAEELYNKELRPVVAKKVKPAPELEVIEPEFVQKVVETAEVFPEDAVINLEEAAETPKPAKKKRKYYPKKKK
jgi:hypothetical protein